MATTPEWHDRITASIGGAENYGKGIENNPWVAKQAEWWRRLHFTLSYRDLPPAKEIGNTGYYQLMEDGE